MCTHKNTSLTCRLKPKVSVLAVQFSMGHLLIPLMLQATSLPLGFVPTATVDIPWYLISNVAILPGSYGKVNVNVILNQGHIVGTNRNQVNTSSPLQTQSKGISGIYSIKILHNVSIVYSAPLYLHFS